jgi:hypothetical protein
MTTTTGPGMEAKGAVVEIVERSADPENSLIIPSVVRVNGTDVGLIAEDGVQIRVTGSDPVQVLLTLLPDRVEIKREETARQRVAQSPTDEPSVEAGHRAPRPSGSEMGSRLRVTALLRQAAHRLAPHRAGQL